MQRHTPQNSGKTTKGSRWIRALICLVVIFEANTALADARAPDSTIGSATVEEARVADACKALKVLKCGTQISVPSLLSGKLGPADPAELSRLGTQLWRRAQQSVDAKLVDDRLLYWQRLSLKRDFKADHLTDPGQLDQLEAFERASRGFDDLAFTTDADLNILITGFDPFGLHNRIDQSNPSGIAALSFDGLVISGGGKRAELQSAMFPVRFQDFDNGMVESVLVPLLAEGQLDAIVTISMGREGFDLERFPGRRRSATAPDNLLVKTGANAKNPLVPRLHDAPLDGAEFVEFTLPVLAMLAVQAPYPVRDNHNVATLKRGRFAATSIDSLANATAVSGSGGGYLSNEISYRSLRLVRNSSGKTIAAGHIHTPRIEGADATASHAITWQIRTLLEALLTELPVAN